MRPTGQRLSQENAIDCKWKEVTEVKVSLHQEKKNERKKKKKKPNDIMVMVVVAVRYYTQTKPMINKTRSVIALVKNIFNIIASKD